MEDVETFERNSESFKDSIINTLNLDASIIENRINEELFDTYINTILKKELDNTSDEEILFNPIIIKLSKVENVYERYAASITNLTHKKYIEKIKKSLNNKQNFKIIEDYVCNNNDIDYNNEIENYILSLYASKILKDELKNLNDQKWFINYIINVNAKKQNMYFEVIGYEFPKIRRFKLFKNNIFREIKDIDNYYNKENIYINLGLFKFIKKTKGFESALLYLINLCLIELQKHIQKNKEYSMYYDDNIYRFIKENIIYSEDSSFYDKNKNYFDIEIDLKKQTDNMLIELSNNPLFKDFDFIKDISNDNNTMIKNTKDYNTLDTYIDSLLLKKPNLLEDYPLLQMEYNSNGERKSINDLIDLKKEKIKFYNDQIETFEELLESAPNDAYKKDINNKLETIKNNLFGIIRCHNKMIYKALRKINVSKLENLCISLSKEDLNVLEEVINQEKNDFIKKLEDNRKKIFKTSMFLANEQFLTKEYSLSARYESKLRDIRKEKEI